MGLNMAGPPAPRPSLLLQPQVPKPLHGIAPRTILGEGWWQAAKEETRKIYMDTCGACGVNAGNKGACHEVYEYDYAKGRGYFIEVVYLCKLCHSYIHLGLTEVQYKKGEITQELFEMIKRRGDSILEAKGLVKEPYHGKLAGWKAWRLVINHKEYRGNFANINEWAAFYGMRLIKTEDLYEQVY